MIIGVIIICCYMLCAELGLEPEFDETFTNVTVVAGHTATLSCSIRFLGKHKVHLLYVVIRDFSCPHTASVGVRPQLRYHLVLCTGEVLLDSYFGCPARSSFRTNFPWLYQCVVERESWDETRIRLPM